MGFCNNCSRPLPEGAQFCPACGARVETSNAKVHGRFEENVFGVVLFGGYYRDICLTDRRLIQFEVMRDRWKFLTKAAGLLPLVVDRETKLGDVLPFIKLEIPRSQIFLIDLKNHTRFGRGHIRIKTIAGQETELARIDLDVKDDAFQELTAFLTGSYPEVRVDVS
jgi:hypothetical protein